MQKLHFFQNMHRKKNHCRSQYNKDNFALKSQIFSFSLFESVSLRLLFLYEENFSKTITNDKCLNIILALERYHGSKCRAKMPEIINLNLIMQKKLHCVLKSFFFDFYLQVPLSCVATVVFSVRLLHAVAF